MTEYTARKAEVDVHSDQTLELAEDEFILDSRWRGANIIVVGIATPISEEYECGVNGCSRTVDGAEKRCWQHED